MKGKGDKSRGEREEREKGIINKTERNKRLEVDRGGVRE